MDWFSREMDGGLKEMKLVFNMDGVICTEEPPELYKWAQPLLNVPEFMQWLKKNGHHITIWCERTNEMQVKMATEEWLEINNVPYDRLLFDRPRYPIFVDETPPNAKYRGGVGDNSTIAMLFEEWKEWYQLENTEK